MSGYDSVNRNVSSRVRKVARDGADVTSGGRQFHTWGPARCTAVEDLVYEYGYVRSCRCRIT